MARAAAGQRRRSTSPADLTRSSDVVYVVACWPEDARYGDADGGPPPTTGFALGSTDGRRWQVEPLYRPAYEASVQIVPSLAAVRGWGRSLVWRKDAGDFETLDLPLLDPAVDGVTVIGDEVFRVLGNPDLGRRCRPRWVTDEAEDGFGDIPPGRRVVVSAYDISKSAAVRGQLERRDGTSRLR